MAIAPTNRTPNTCQGLIAATCIDPPMVNRGLLLISQASGNAIHLVAGLNLSHQLDLCRSCRFGIYVCDGARESAERAFRRGVLDPALLHDPRHEFYGLFI